MGKHDHPHVEASGASLSAAAQRALESAGEAWTDMRAQIFDAVAEIGKPASAYEIADIVSQKRGKRVAPNSVYRILDLFVRANLANRIESSNAYIVNTHPGCLHDCIFLICDNCGQTTHFDDDRITGSLRDAGRKSGFSDVRPVVELRGTCAACH